MSERIVFRLYDPVSPAHDEAAPPGWLTIEEPEGHHGTWSFACLSNETVFAELSSGSNDGNVVEAAGKRLFAELMSAEPGVSNLLTEALGVPAGHRRPVYFDLSNAAASRELPWETLCTATGKFLSLQQWPVARMVGSTAGVVTTRKLSPPLRIAAVLSCLEVDPRGEWDAITRAIESSGCEVKVLLLLSDPDLFDEVAAQEHAWLDVDMIPRRFLDLQARITRFGPNILHLFCHGGTSGSPHLQIATADNLKAPWNGSNYRLEASGVRDLVGQPTEAPWAVVLNACSGAATGEESGTRSLAETLVREHGLQVVVGMREPVLSTDAARFTDAFYRAVLDEVGQHILAGTPEAEIDWASFTVQARTELCPQGEGHLEAGAARSRAWTLPVVTVRPAPFTIGVVSEAATPGAEFDRLFAEFKATLLANFPLTIPTPTLAAFSPSGDLGGSATGS